MIDLMNKILNHPDVEDRYINRKGFINEDDSHAFIWWGYKEGGIFIKIHLYNKKYPISNMVPTYPVNNFNILLRNAFLYEVKIIYFSVNDNIIIKKENCITINEDEHDHRK